MAEQRRTEGGKFAAKSDEPRHVRSIRLTNSAWEFLGAIARERSITRADLLEELVEVGAISSHTLTSRSGHTAPEIGQLIEQVLADPAVTRGGKDKGAVRRGLEALKKLLK